MRVAEGEAEGEVEEMLQQIEAVRTNRLLTAFFLEEEPDSPPLFLLYLLKWFKAFDSSISSFLWYNKPAIIGLKHSNLQKALEAQSYPTSTASFL